MSAQLDLIPACIRSQRHKYRERKSEKHFDLCIVPPPHHRRRSTNRRSLAHFSLSLSLTLSLTHTHTHTHTCACNTHTFVRVTHNCVFVYHTRPHVSVCVCVRARIGLTCSRVMAKSLSASLGMVHTRLYLKFASASNLSSASGACRP